MDAGATETYEVNMMIMLHFLNYSNASYHLAIKSYIILLSCFSCITSEFTSLFLFFSSVCFSALDYYLSLEADVHRDAWSSLMILIFSKLHKLSDEKVMYCNFREAFFSI